MENRKSEIGEWEILLGGFFYQVVRTRGGFFQSWKQHSVNIEHQLKSKLHDLCAQGVWSENKNGTGAVTTAKI